LGGSTFLNLLSAILQPASGVKADMSDGDSIKISVDMKAAKVVLHAPLILHPHYRVLVTLISLKLQL
jgi:hypothetical protein